MDRTGLTEYTLYSEASRMAAMLSQPSAICRRMTVTNQSMMSQLNRPTLWVKMKQTRGTNSGEVSQKIEQFG